MATIKDVARMAGVSIATVSNYLNQTKPVSRESSEKIQKAVDALQYNLNLTAKSLKSNTYSDIGIILPNFDDPYYVQLFQGIENAFQNTSRIWPFPTIFRNLNRTSSSAFCESRFADLS